ncbi:MAG TPA: formate dehydrogenase accessory sulfurtransferase FdhD [Nannocystis sp.]
MADGAIPVPGAVPETPIWVEVNGSRVAVWSCSPEHIRALAVGWLVAEGALAPGDDIPDIELLDDAGVLGARIRIAPEAAARMQAERDHRREHGCGLAFFVRCAPETIGRGPVAGVPPQDVDFPALFRELYASGEQYRETGGVHTAALSDGRSLLYRVEEVGRHNAVDKVIGMSLLDGRALAGLGLVTTARISGDIALKAARAGLGWIASRSVPTTLALAIANVAGITIVGRAAGKEPRVYRPERSTPGGATA